MAGTRSDARKRFDAEAERTERAGSVSSPSGREGGAEFGFEPDHTLARLIGIRGGAEVEVCFLGYTEPRRGRLECYVVSKDGVVQSVRLRVAGSVHVIPWTSIAYMRETS